MFVEPRIIPCLLLSRGQFVKTAQFGDPRYVGDPVNVLSIFSSFEVDEIVVLDVGDIISIVEAFVFVSASNTRLVRTIVDEIELALNEPIAAITPGQSVVFYAGDSVVGGGVIERAQRDRSGRHALPILAA